MSKSKKPKPIAVKKQVDPARARAIRRVTLHTLAALAFGAMLVVGVAYLRAHVEKLVIPLENGEQLRVTVSIGVATRADVRGDGHTRARPLLSAADAALYAAKRGGRNRVETAARTPEGE